MKRNVLNSPRLLKLKKHRRNVFLNKIFLFILALLAVFAGLVYVSRLSSLNISSVEIIGNKITDTETIKTAVQKEIMGNYLWFFPKTNILFYPKNDIKRELNIQVKRLKDINLSIKNNKILEVSVTEREAKYLWCNLVVGLPSEEKCSFMDEDGFIFDEAPYFSGEVYFKFYGSLSQVNFEKLILFKKTLETIEIKPTALRIEENGDIKIFLSALNKTPTGSYIILKADSDFQKVAENLEIALGTEPLLSDFKNKYSSLLYIDLRFGNKVYYKFK